MNQASLDQARVYRGMAMVMTAVALFSVMDATSKYLTRYYPVALVVWARYTFHLIMVVLLLGPRHGTSLLRTERPLTQIVRGMLLVASSAFFVAAVKFLPLAESSAIAFLGPLLITAMSVVFLKEKVEAARWVAVCCGFVGVLIVIRPGSDVFSWAALLPLGNACSFATYQIITRRVAGRESPYTSIFYVGLVGTVLLSTLLPSVWVTPKSLFDVALFVLSGVLGGISHLLLIKAYEHAPASRIAPFSYTQLIWVAIVGYLLFNDFPDRWSLLGMGILVASGIYSAAHQYRAHAQASAS